MQLQSNSSGALMWRWIERNREQIKIVFAVIAAIYAVTEYRFKIHDDHVDKALSYIEKHAEGKVIEARTRIYQFWVSDKTEEWLKQLRREVPAKRFARYDKELPDLIKSENITSDVYLLMDYYGSVALCVKSSLCDSGAICQNLFNDVQGYRQTYKVLLSQWKRDLGDTAPDEIAYLTEKTCAAQFANYCKAAPTTSNCPP